ncbi:Ms4533A family Cys-rich leader peptide [Rhodococcoides kroppenstedtii]
MIAVGMLAVADVDCR